MALVKASVASRYRPRANSVFPLRECLSARSYTSRLGSSLGSTSVSASTRTPPGVSAVHACSGKKAPPPPPFQLRNRAVV
eukprot:178393-Pyramimonas_sp.AAC.1